jgi:hypothetical protein
MIFDRVAIALVVTSESGFRLAQFISSLTLNSQLNLSGLDSVINHYPRRP